jgi:hypothetical protein
LSPVNHHINAVSGSFFDDRKMIPNFGVDQECLGVSAVDHLIDPGIEELGVEIKLHSVPVRHRGIGFLDSNELNLRCCGS